MKSNINAALNQLQAKDTMSLVLFLLYKLADCPEYSAISELGYILNGESLSNLLDYYGGMTIRIPTKAEMNIVVAALSIYQYVQLDGGSFDDAMLEMGKDPAFNEELKDTYKKISQLLDKYDFSKAGD